MCKQSVRWKNRCPPLTHKFQAVVVRVGLNEADNIAILHSFRYDRKEWWVQRNTNKWQDVLVVKPFPSNNLFNKKLMAERERPLLSGGGRPLTRRTLLIVSALTVRTLTATRRPSWVASYTSEKPPVANGVVPRPPFAGVSMKDEGRTSKAQHSFRRYPICCLLSSLGRSLLSRA